jgi:hypothetical protein
MEGAILWSWKARHYVGQDRIQRCHTGAQIADQGARSIRGSAAPLAVDRDHAHVFQRHRRIREQLGHLRHAARASASKR